MSTIYGKSVILNARGNGYVISETEPEKKNILWIHPNGLAKFWNGSEWVAIAGVYAEEEG